MKRLSLLGKIKKHTAVIAVVGIGYVGSAVAHATARAGFQVTGIDIDKNRIRDINKLKTKNFVATDDFHLLDQSDIIIVCVPTPVTVNHKPDLSILISAIKQIARYMQQRQLIVVESSVAPETTRKVILPLFQKKLRRLDRDFYLAYSPERIDPGNTKYGISEIPKIVGGLSNNSLDLATAFYHQIVRSVVPVATVETAEMTKVLENTFRLVNISFVNELLPFAQKIDVNLWDVIDAAATKPFGFLPHFPGPGAGGDCIPVLPYYLLQQAHMLKISLPLTSLAAKINENQPAKIADLALKILSAQGKNKHPKVILLGVGYKKDLPEIRFSSALKVWDELQKNGIRVSFHDPYSNQLKEYFSLPLTLTTLKDYDLAVVTTAHTNIDYATLVRSKIPILDTTNVLKKYSRNHIFRI